MKTYPTLYSRDTTGKVRIWWMEQDGPRYRTVAGLQDGEKVISEWRRAYTTNEGRSNERDPHEQAKFEVNAQYKKKLSMKYHERVETIDSAKYFKPMLAQSVNDHPLTDEHWNAGLFSQPKLDGIRSITEIAGSWSRNGKPIVAVPHIYRAMEEAFELYPNLILDGELYNHALKDDFNAISSAVRKLKVTPKILAESEKLVQYHVYDIPSDGELPFSERWDKLQQMFQVLWGTDHPHMILVRTAPVASRADLDALYYDDYLEDGYEGQMIRVDGKPYQQKRVKHLLKRKEFKDDEFKIVAIEEGQGNWSGHAKRVVCEMSDGRQFGAGLKGNKAFAKKLLKEADDWAGKEVTVRYQKETPDGIPRFGVAHAFHKRDRW